VLGHLLKARQIRQWIRGGTPLSNEGPRVVPSVANIMAKVHERLHGDRSRSLSAEQRMRLERHFNSSYSIINPIITTWDLLDLLLHRAPKAFVPLLDPCDPNGLIAQSIPEANFKNFLQRICFTPCVSAVITISAPQTLLTYSLSSLFVALGIYFGFTWTRNLDPDRGLHDSRNVFIMFIVGLGVCLAVYTISQFIRD
jgi:hypothetical protein